MDFVKSFDWNANLLDQFLIGVDVDNEIKELIGLIEYRPDMLAEGIFQIANIEDPFRGILTFGASTHPNTTRLIGVALQMAVVAEFYYKRLYARPRPSQISPALMPPIDPPSHAAFPSGHATESMIVALTLQVFMPDLSVQHLDKLGVAQSDRRDPLLDMAHRIARNREIIGLHYPSDSRAGQFLAQKVFATLQNMEILGELWVSAKKNGSAPRYGSNFRRLQSLRHICKVPTAKEKESPDLAFAGRPRASSGPFHGPRLPGW